MTIGWNFPSNNFGTLNGIGEAGIETFKGSPYKSLAREICQNSLDAKISNDKPVVVEFSCAMVSTSQIPDFDVLKDSIESCLSFWTSQNNKKTIDFFKRAYDVANQKYLPVLRISDFNTTGLVGSDKDYNTPWQNLVKASGVSAKTGDSGGSFGIGKSAPFACSDLRTVFYATKDQNGLEAYQGIARLVSFPLNKDGNMSTGTGFYGNMEKNSSITSCKSFIPNYYRDKIGTDVFVLGLTNDKNWKTEIIASVLDDFLIAINKGLLEVRIENITISKSTLSEVIEQYKESSVCAYNYYLALTSPDAYSIDADFEDLGKVELHILIRANMHRRVLISRRNGMKILDQKNFPSTIQFAGICVFKDEIINAYFRNMENPQHNNWEPIRQDNPVRAKKYIVNLHRFIKETIIDLGKKTTVEEMDAEGVGEYLPDDIGFVSGDKQHEAIADSIKSIDVSVSNLKTSQKGFENYNSGKYTESEDVNSLAEDEAFGDNGGKNFADDDQNSSPADSGFGGSDGLGSGRNGEGDNVYGVGGSEGTPENVRQSYEMHTISVRLFIVDVVKNRYRLIFKPEKTSGEGFLKLKLSGEQSDIDSIKVKNAVLLDTGKILETSKNIINLPEITANKKMIVEFDVDYNEKSSMEVSLYGFKI